MSLEDLGNVGEFVGTPGFTRYWARSRHRASSSCRDFFERLLSSAMA